MLSIRRQCDKDYRTKDSLSPSSRTCRVLKKINVLLPIPARADNSLKTFITCEKLPEHCILRHLYVLKLI